MSPVAELAAVFEKNLKTHYQPGFGIMPSGAKNENFYGQLWARDFAHAAGNYFVTSFPEAVQDSLDTLFTYQRPDGALPYKIEQEYALIRIIPGLWPLAKPLFKLIEGKKRLARPLYEGEDTNGAEDTIPVIIIATGLFLGTAVGRPQARRYYEHVRKAAHYFESKVDPRDGLAVVSRRNPDWTESIQRTGKLGFVNVLWVESLYVMQQLSEVLNEPDAAREYEEKYLRSKQSLMEKLYNQRDGYFRSKVDEERMDTAASLFGALFFLDAEEARIVAETVETRAGAKSGIRNFDPHYPSSAIHVLNRFFGTSGYHNAFVWPWITCLNIRLTTKIALNHSNPVVRAAYKEKALKALANSAQLFKDAGGGYEVMKPNKSVSARSLFYSPPRNFLASLAGYEGAYKELANLGWL